MTVRIPLIAALLAVFACACAVGNQDGVRVKCPSSETRLYVDLYQGVRPGDLEHRILHWVDVYCGANTKPAATLRDGIANLASQIEHDNRGNIYLSDYAGEHNPGAPPDAFLIYGSSGRLEGRIPVPGDLRYFVTEKSSGESTLFYFAKNGQLRAMSVGGAPPHVQRDVAVPAEAEFPLMPALDKNGTMFYENQMGHVVHLMNLTAMSVLPSSIENVDSFIIGDDDRVYARAFAADAGRDEGASGSEEIRVFDPRTLQMIRSFPIAAKSFRDKGVSAASIDGTFALALGESRVIAVYAPRGDVPIAVIKDVDNVDGLAFDNDDTLYVMTSSRGRLGTPGVYAFKLHTAEVLRKYSFEEAQGPEDMTLIRGGTLK